MKFLNLLIFIVLTIVVLELPIKCDDSLNSQLTKKYIAHIFNKYGSKGVITFDGLEHLMNDLGIGGLEFSPSHTIKEHRPEGFSDSDLFDVVGFLENHFKGKDSSYEYGIRNDKLIEDLDQIVDEDKKIRDTNGAPRDYDSISGDNTFDEDNKYQWIDRNHGIQYDKLHQSCLSPFAIARIYGQNSHSNENKKYNYLTEVDETAAEENLAKERIINKRSYSEHELDRKFMNSEKNNGNEHEHFIATTIKVTPDMFMAMCPTLLGQIESKSCNKEIPVIEVVDFFDDAWLYATVSILIISLCGLSGVALIPLAKSVAYKEVLRFLVSIAVGTLCGDALMHLLPHALAPHIDHGNDSIRASTHENVNDEPVWICACAFCSALFMYVIETGLPILTGKTAGHGHSHGSTKNASDDTNLFEMNLAKPNAVKETNVMLEENALDKKDELSPVAFMVIIGDGLHNITDGLAIGAAFSLDPITGMATALAVLAHELPHELGDFALLISTGVSVKRAIYYNLVSSVLSIIGMIVGIVIAQIQTSFVRWIYSATAGSFLYIAFADLIPELNKEGKDNMKLVLIQVLGIGIGGIIMLLIGLNEDRLRVLFE